jgi:hypothetical protein
VEIFSFERPTTYHHTLMKTALLALFTLLLICVTSSKLKAQDTESSIPAIRGVQTSHTSPAPPVHGHDSLRAFSLTSEVELESEETGVVQGSCAIGVCGMDSMALTIYGPFGVLVGKMAASKNSVVYYDALRSEAVQGDPESPKVVSSLPFPLTFTDFMHLTRWEVPFPTASYKFLSAQDSSAVWAYTENPAFIDVAKVRTSDGALYGYQRKSRKGEIIFSMRFDDVRNRNGVNFPSTLTMQFPSRNASARFAVIDFVRDPVGERYSFRLPKGVKCKRLE